MAWKGLHKTHAGIALINQCMTSGDLMITRVEIGSGSYAGDLAYSTGCVNPVLVFSGDNLRVTRKGDTTSIEVSITNAGLAEAFYYREHAIYATDGQTEVCLLYDNAGADADLYNDSSTTFIRDIDDRVCFEVTISAEASVNVSYRNGPYVYSDGGDIGNTVITFTEAEFATVDELESGSALSFLFGKIKRLLRNFSRKIDSMGLPTFVSQEMPLYDGDFIWITDMPVPEKPVDGTLIEATSVNADSYEYQMVDPVDGDREGVINMTDDISSADEDDVIVS